MRWFRQVLIVGLATVVVACGGGGGGGSSPAPVTIGGTVSGLASGAQLVLQNGGTSTTVSANGAFTLQGTVPVNGSYAVTVAGQPTNQTCTVSGGAGSGVTGNVTSVSVSCLSTGQFIDAPVSGLGYVCSSANGSTPSNSGITQGQGQFTFAVGQGCSFKVGNVTVGSVAAVPVDNIVTPQDLAGVIRSATGSPAPLAIAQLLQSLDDRSVPGAITIPAAVTQALGAVPAASIISSTTGVMPQAALLELVRAAGKASLVSPAAAAAQLEQELGTGRVKAATGAITAASPVALNSIVLAATNASVPAGLSGKLTATGHYSDGTTRDLTSTATWASSSTAVANVSAGSLTGVAPGAVTVSAQSGGVTGVLAFQVGAPVLQSLAVSPSSPSVPAGRNTDLVVTATYSDNSKSTSPTGLAWTSSAPGIATVNSGGKVDAVSVGTTTITAAVGAVSTSTTLTVLEPTITSIVISAISNAVDVGGTLALNALANLSNSTQKNITAVVSWIVNLVGGSAGGDATAVARVSTDGASNTATLTGVGAGNIAVAASYQGVRSEALGVTVTSPFLTTQRWVGAQLEGNLPYCQDRTLRWISPIRDFDINRDGVNDILLPISCYQGPDPNGKKNNQKVISAWKLFCSAPGDKHYDCTQEKFGSPVIGASGTDWGGGNPDVYAMDRPMDINGDGYPDIWYALNRDDGRPGFDDSNPQDYALLTDFCGAPQIPLYEFDCTRKSKQSVLLSRADGTYEVVYLPWAPTNTARLIMLPNHLGGYDAIAFNYGDPKAARLVGRSFVDVTDEYLRYDNFWRVTTQVSLGVFESNGVTYIAQTAGGRSEIPESYVDPKYFNVNGGWGFALWRWEPGRGFSLSDYYSPPAADIFTYKEDLGGVVESRYGAYIKGMPMFTPRWHQYHYVTLDPAEGPILVVGQESGTLLGAWYKTQIDPAATYSWNASQARYLISQAFAVEAFYIRNGRLVPRVKSVIEGDLFRNVYLSFENLNSDGFADAISLGPFGHQLFRNDGKGTLQRLDTAGIIPVYTRSSDSIPPGFGVGIRRLGTSNRLAVTYWGNENRRSWSGSNYLAPDVTIVQTSKTVDDLKVLSAAEQQRRLQLCVGNITKYFEDVSCDWVWR